MLTEWAGQCWRELETEREEKEQKGVPSIFESAFVDTGCMITADMTDDDDIKELKKIQKVRNDLKLKSESELLREIAEEDCKPKPFFLYLSDSEEEEAAGTDDEVVDVSKVMEARPWDEPEAVRKRGDARDRDDFLSAVHLGSDLGVDKEGDHQILCLYEEKVAEWKSNNPGKNIPGTVHVIDKLHTQAIVQHTASKSAGGGPRRSTRAKKAFAGMVH